MTDSVEDPAFESALNEAISTLRTMHHRWSLSNSGLTLHELPFETIERIADYSKFVKKGTEAGEAITLVGEHLDDLPNVPQNEELAHDIHWGGFVLALINFIRIPFLYLSAYLLKQPVPFTLDNNVRFSYATLLLALTITAIALPVAAPIIGFVAAGMALIASGVILGKLLNARYQLRQNERRLARAISLAEADMEAILSEAAILERDLEQTQDEEKCKALLLRVAELEEQFIDKETHLNMLYARRAHTLLLKEKQGSNQLLFRGFSLALAALTIIGLTLALFIPPVGLGIIAGVAAISIGYLLGRLVYSGVQWGRNVMTHYALQQQVHAQEKSGLNKEFQANLEPQEQPTNTESTAEVLRELSSSSIEVEAAESPQLDAVNPVNKPLFAPSSPGKKPSLNGVDDDDDEEENEFIR